MSMVFRRARGAKGLLLAAVGAAFVATALLTALADYSRDVVEAGGRSAIASAPPVERAMVIRGSVSGARAGFDSQDAALRERVGSTLAGRPVAVATAGYAVGQQFAGETGTAVGDPGGIVFASTVFLDHLPEHARLVDGAWPVPGAARPEVTLPRAAAGILGYRVGETVRLFDRRTERQTELRLSGVWEPLDLSDPYWLLVPGVAAGSSPNSASYGPLVLDRADFLAGYVDSSSIGWAVQPDLEGADLADLRRLRTAAATLLDTLPAGAAPTNSGIRRGTAGDLATASEIGRLADRLGRAELVGRSALVTPVLLIAVLSAYALLLVAMLLNEHRRAETALMRARGAARGQLAGLAAREAALVVVPAATLAPFVATEALRYATDLPLLRDVSLRLEPELGLTAWIVAALAATGCLVTMIGPALRRSGTYVEELSSRSRPNRFAVAQRAGIDLALVALAVLAWVQLRQYSSPLAGAGGELGIDPLLAAAPTIGVLAGAVVALRLLPQLTRLGERWIDRRSWTATMFGMWQAGRRPHAGPVLLLALAVASSTLAWSLASTAERSLVDQADHLVGADLRLVESGGFAPVDRPGQLADLPGVRAVLPAARNSLLVGPQALPVSFVALDTERATAVVRYRPDLVDGSAAALFERLREGRPAVPATALPADARRLRGEWATSVEDTEPSPPVDVAAILTDGQGQLFRVALATHTPGTAPTTFDVELPDLGGRPLGLVGVDVDLLNGNTSRYSWRLRDVAASTATGARTPVDFDAGQWRLTGATPDDAVTAAGPGTLAGGYRPVLPAPSRFENPLRMRFLASRVEAGGPIPVAVTGPVLRALRATVGEVRELSLAGTPVDVRLVAEVQSLPGTTSGGTGGPGGAVLADLSTLTSAVLLQSGEATPVQEYWVATAGGQAGATAAAARRLGGIDVLDRTAIIETAGREPYGVGGRAGLLAAALGAVLLALVGVAVDVRATARRRVGEFAVLNTLGAGPRLLARSLMAEQAFLAGLGVVVGLLVGVGVAAVMAPLVILTPSANRPVPSPDLAIAWLPVGLTALSLLAVSLLLGALVATTLRQRLAAAQLRIGDER